MRIGELSEATGVSTRSLRYYEQQGLLQSRRRANAYREYSPDAVEQVAFIQDLFSAGLFSQLIRDSLPPVGQPRSPAACTALRARVREAVTNSHGRNNAWRHAGGLSTATSRATARRAA